jgi:hypothetical protein
VRRAALIVDARAACMMTSDERFLAVEVDHVQMCQFKGTEDTIFKEVIVRVLIEVATGVAR